MHRPVTTAATRPSRRLAAVIALAALLAVACGNDDNAASDLERELARAESQIASLRDDNARLTRELDEALASVDDSDPADAPDEQPGDNDASDDADEPAVAGPRVPAQMERTEEGLVDQLRMLFDFGNLPDGWTPGSTPWEAYELPDQVMGTYAEPGLFAADLARILDGRSLGFDVWESTIRVLPGDDADSALAAILSWGFADDSVRGQDVKVWLALEDGAWFAERAQVRYHCLRGVSGDLCV